MNQKTLKDEIFEVRCANCHKPFHITARTKSDEPGEEMIVLNCPYCSTPLTVNVPRRVVGTDVTFRKLDSRKTMR